MAGQIDEFRRIGCALHFLPQESSGDQGRQLQVLLPIKEDKKNINDN
jgi:hypothetical protein